MAQSLEEYVAQATQAYQPAQNALQSQLNALAGKLETTNQAINKNYAQQQATLNRNRNSAAETASMQAAGSGGSFGGAANIANRKYYEQSFVPAQTQLQTNQANELAQARQNSENERTSLNSQLANMQSQANQQALAQYYADVAAEQQRIFEAEQAEKNRKAQIAAAQASSPYQYLPDGYSNTSSSNKINKQNVSFTDWLNSDSYGALKYAQGNTQQEKVRYLQNLAKQYTSSLNSANRKGISGILPSQLLRTIQNSSIYRAYNNWRNS